MDCDRHQQALIELACGEVPDATHEAARSHAESCSACGALRVRLDRGATLARALPMAEPSAAVTERIMQQARAHAGAVSAMHPTRVKPAPLSWGDRVREFLSQFAMGRQFAMATMTVLIVSVGLWLVPAAQRHQLSGSTVVDADPTVEAGPSNGIVPAEPLDLDLRQGRIRARGGPELARDEGEPQAATVATAAASPEEAQPTIAEEAKKEVDSIIEAPANAPTEEVAASAASADMLQREALGTLESPERDTAPRAPVAAAPRAKADDQDLAGGSMFGEELAAPLAAEQEAPAAAPARFAPPPAQPAAPITRKGRASSSGAGLALEAQDAFAPAPPPQATAPATPPSPLATARALRSQGRCDQAITHYEHALRLAPSNRAAMLEAIACYRTLGRATDVDRLQARLVTLDNSVKSSARKAEPAAAATAE